MFDTSNYKPIPCGWRDLEKPLKARRSRIYEVSDLFHSSVTDEQLDQIFAVMALTPQHTYQVLTKRPQRMLEYCSKSDWSANTWKTFPQFAEVPYIWPLPNVWLGVTVENQRVADERIPLLLQTPAAVRFLSCEPLLEDVEINCIKHVHDWGEVGGKEEFAAWNPLNPLDGNKIDWVIIGGESGPKARPFDITWARSIIQQCKAADIPVFMKQLGSNSWLDSISYTDADPSSRYKATGKGANPDEWPEDLRVREYPNFS